MIDIISPDVSNKTQSQETDRQKIERLTREAKELTTLYNMGVVIDSTLNLKGVIWALYEESSRLLDTSNFAIAIYDSQSSNLYFSLVFNQGKQTQPFSVKLSNSQKLVKQVITSKSPLLVSDLLKLNPPTNSQTRCWLGVPIFNSATKSKKIKGVIVVWSKKPAAFDKHDLWLLSAIGAHASIAIRNSRLYEASQRRAMEMAVLNDVAQTLSSTLNLEELLTRIMDQVEGMLNVEAGSLLLTDVSTGELVFQIALGDKGDEVKPFRIPKGEGIAGQVSLTGEPLIVEDVEQDKRHFKEVDQKTSFITYNLMCVPLILYERIIGVLEVMNKRDGQFTKNDLRLLSSVASYAAIAIQNARLHQNVLAERDRVIETEEQARKKLARDLHDGPTQLVAAIMMSLDFSQKALQKDPSLLPKELEYMTNLAKKATHQMRTMLFELRPLVLETQGLGSALQVFIDRRQKDVSEKLKLSLHIEAEQPGGDISRQDDKVETTVFAIVQETVNNAIKHAKANEITVSLKETADALYTIIADDGAGFDIDEVMSNYEERGSLGMINIRERTEAVGGELTMNSALGHGTKIIINIPKEKEVRKKKRSGITAPLVLSR